MRIPPFLYALLVTTVALVACGRANPAAESPARSGSTPIELRIVALSPALAIILKDLGYESQIVGRHAYDIALDRSIPTCGELGTLDYESLISVRPTHVFIQWGAQGLPPRLTELAKTNGWVVKNLNPLTLDEIETVAREMDQEIFNFATRELEASPVPTPKPTMPEHLKPAMPFEDAMHLAWSDRGPFMKAAGRVLLIAGTKPIGALGPGSFHSQLLERLGATPALITGGPWVTLDLEDLSKLAPDGIIIFSPRPPRSEKVPAKSVDELIALFGRAGELPIPAFKNKRVALIDDPACLTPSTAMIGVADQVAEIVGGWGESAKNAAAESGGR